jgi:poly(hydroxyalkanoate) depolymerase family esterase
MRDMKRQSAERAWTRRLRMMCVVIAAAVMVWPAAAGAATLPGLPGWTGTTPWWTNVEQWLGTIGWKLPAGGHPVPPKPAPSPAPSPSPSPPGGGGAAGKGTTFSGNYTGSAGTRAYRGYVPSTYVAGQALPLVVVLHGCTQSAQIMSSLTRFSELAESRHFIVVYPEQPSSANQQKCWNFFQDAHAHRGSGEPSLIAGITKWVQGHYAVDPHRTYVAGLSAGGAMASVMGATYPDLYAAIGVGSGCEYGATATCAGYKSADPAQAGKAAYGAMGQFARPLPVIAFEGDKDTTVPPVNAEQLITQWQLTADLADDATANGSVPVASLKTVQGQVPGGESYTETIYGDAQGNELMQSWLVHGMGHAWSGGCSCESYADPKGPDETAAMYAFFTAHPMP